MALAHAGRALAGEADALALANALRDGDGQGAVLDGDVAAAVHLRHAQGDLALGAGVSIAQVDGDLGVVILALSVKLALRRKAAASGTRAPCVGLPEEALEKVGELRRVGFGVAAAGELEALIPVRRRTEVLALLPVGAELIVGGALLGVFQDLVGLAGVLELGLGAGLLVHVRMKRARHLAVGALDVVLRGVFLDAEDFVVVLVFHGATRSWSAPAGASVPIPRFAQVAGSVESELRNQRDTRIIALLA